MFEVRFIMNDGSTDQEYFYHQFKDAEYHFHLFDDDDSGLYFSIEIQNGDTTVVRRIKGFEEEELSLIFTADKADLTDLCIYLRDLSARELNESKKESLIRLRLKIENWAYSSYERFMQIISESITAKSVSMQKPFLVL